MNVDGEINNDKLKPQADTLTDLQVTDEQDDETKGGAGTRDTDWRESVFGNELMTG